MADIIHEDLQQKVNDICAELMRLGIQINDSVFLVIGMEVLLDHFDLKSEYLERLVKKLESIQATVIPALNRAKILQPGPNRPLG